MTRLVTTLPCDFLLALRRFYTAPACTLKWKELLPPFQKKKIFDSFGSIRSNAASGERPHGVPSRSNAHGRGLAGSDASLQTAPRGRSGASPNRRRSLGVRSSSPRQPPKRPRFPRHPFRSSPRIKRSPPTSKPKKSSTGGKKKKKKSGRRLRLVFLHVAPPLRSPCLRATATAGHARRVRAWSAGGTEAHAGHQLQLQRSSLSLANERSLLPVARCFSGERALSLARVLPGFVLN